MGQQSGVSSSESICPRGKSPARFRSRIVICRRQAYFNARFKVIIYPQEPSGARYQRQCSPRRKFWPRHRTRNMVMISLFVPERGDIVWVTLDPQAGHEQAGRRPALVLSPRSYNAKVGLAILCPVTNQIKGYPFEVLLPEGFKVQGAILSDQVKCLDWKSRKAEFICKLPHHITADVLLKLNTLLGNDS